jgi:hypothetical protein
MIFIIRLGENMSCKYVQITNQRINSMGGSYIQQEVNCKLKMVSQEQQEQVCLKLFDLGLEGNMLSDVCPVAETGNWSACPFRKT